MKIMITGPGGLHINGQSKGQTIELYRGKQRIYAFQAEFTVFSDSSTASTLVTNVQPINKPTGPPCREAKTSPYPSILTFYVY